MQAFLNFKCLITTLIMQNLMIMFKNPCHISKLNAVRVSSFVGNTLTCSAIAFRSDDPSLNRSSWSFSPPSSVLSLKALDLTEVSINTAGLPSVVLLKRKADIPLYTGNKRI